MYVYMCVLSRSVMSISLQSSGQYPPGSSIHGDSPGTSMKQVVISYSRHVCLYMCMCVCVCVCVCVYIYICIKFMGCEWIELLFSSFFKQGLENEERLHSKANFSMQTSIPGHYSFIKQLLKYWYLQKKILVL